MSPRCLRLFSSGAFGGRPLPRAIFDISVETVTVAADRTTVVGMIPGDLRVDDLALR
jgi:hypothetical protein